jgi:acetyl esterase/lipase
MSIPELTPGVRLANLLAACETYCQHGCCGIEAFHFSPLHVAAHLSRCTGAIDAVDVRQLLDELDALLLAAARLTPGEHGFVCSVIGTNQNFSMDDLRALAARIEWALEVAPSVLARSDELEQAFADGSVQRRERTVEDVMRTYRYGVAEHQQGDLYLPAGISMPPVICLLHGGFWRMPYGREQFDAIARDLAARGFAVWNTGYRRVGAPGGGWPGTLQDVAVGIDHLATLVAGGIALDLDRVCVVGHSAGGQLALWAAARTRPDPLRGPVRVRPCAAVGLAPVADLVGAHALAVGNDAVGALLGGSPAHVAERYAAASPLALLPLGVPQLIVHGAEDAALPIELARRYVQAAQASGDDVEFVELQRAGHMEYLDPASEAHAVLCRWLMRLQRQAPQR